MSVMKEADFPKVLIISHNLYDISNNIGKTLVSLFEGWPKEKLSQIYFRNDEPSFNYCNEYFCITDKEVLKSAVSLRYNRAGAVLKTGVSLSVTQTEVNLYQVGNHRRPAVSFIRDTMWALGGWKSDTLKKWVTNVVKPDVILFVPNDYTLAYRVALYIEDIVNKTLIPFYMDDPFYFGCKSSFVDQLRRKSIRRFAKRFTICDYMSQEYHEEFGLDCYAFVNSVHIDADTGEYSTSRNSLIFSYLGNLHSNRWKSLLEIGLVLEEIKVSTGVKAELRIYSGSFLENSIRKLFDSTSTIKFMGRIDAKDVRKKQLESDVLVHVEAFDLMSTNSTRLSLSTKIPEYFSVKRAILAYGPKNIASMRYLNDYELAEVCFDKEELKDGVASLMNRCNRELLAKKAYERAVSYHNIKNISNDFQERIIECR